MDAMTARTELRKIRYARDEGLLSAFEVAERTAAVLDRSPMERLDVSEFLRGKGHEGKDLYRLVGLFSSSVRDEYVRVHGAPPLKRMDLLDVGRRPVNAYVVDDLPLFEAAYVSVMSSTAVSS